MLMTVLGKCTWNPATFTFKERSPDLTEASAFPFLQWVKYSDDMRANFPLCHSDTAAGLSEIHLRKHNFLFLTLFNLLSVRPNNNEAHLVLNIRFKTRDGETSTLNSRFRLIQLNFWHQLYYTPSRLHTFKISISPLRFRCAVEEGTSLHSAWLWPKVKVLWEQVCTIISQIHGLIFHWIQRYVYWAITQILTSSIIKLTQMLLTIAENALL